MTADSTGGYDCPWVEDPPQMTSSVWSVYQLLGTLSNMELMMGVARCSVRLVSPSASCPNCRKQLTTFKDVKSARHIDALKVKCNKIDNGCQWVNELGSLEDHLQTCGYTFLPCPNQCKAGNEVVHILRKDLDGHLRNKCPRRQFPCQHCNESGEYEERMTTHLKTCEKVKVECPNDKCQSSIPRCEVSSHRCTCLYEVVSCKYSEVGCGETPLRKDLKTHEEDHQLHLKIIMETVLKQSKEMSSLQRERNVDHIKITCLEVSSLESKLLNISSLESKLLNISLPPFTFKISNYLEKRSSHTIYSPPFYTSINGYKLCLAVGANDNGSDKGGHVSVYIYLMKGENDDSLTWPFTGEVTIELLNQLEDKNHRICKTIFPGDNHEVNRRVVDDMISRFGWGYPQYISYTKLDDDSVENCQYLKDDTLIFRVTVKVPNHKSWLECAV